MELHHDAGLDHWFVGEVAARLSRSRSVLSFLLSEEPTRNAPSTFPFLGLPTCGRRVAHALSRHRGTRLPCWRDEFQPSAHCYRDIQPRHRGPSHDVFMSLAHHALL